MTKAEAGKRGLAKTREGVVVSDKMDKTVVVAVERLVRNTMYGKFVRRTSKFMAHDESETCKVGDLVRIKEARPMSSRKRWKVVEVLSRAD